MKKLTTTILSTLGVVSMAFGLSACGHQHTLTKTSAVDATCTTAGNSTYYSCDCGKFFSDAKGETEIQENSWVIDATGHNPQKVDATVSTCVMNGNSEYYACACGKYFSDAQGQNEIAANSWELPLLSHQYDSDVSVIVEEGKAYFVVGCDCSAVEKTEIPNAIIVNSTQTAQQALDNATNNTVIVLDDADYGVLYLRKTDSSELVENDGNWAGGGHTYQRTINGLTILSTEDATIKQIKAETAQYTPNEGGNKHSNSATEPYLTLRLNLNNFTLFNLNFELEDNDVAVDILDNYSMVNGLTLIGCSFIDIDASSNATNGNRALHSSGQNPEDCAKNVVIQGCYFKDLHQGIKINCLENLTVTDNQFYGIKAHTMLLNGTKSNVGGVIVIRDNKIGFSMGERFIRATSIAANAEITVSGNIVTEGIPMGADDDIVKITGIHADATVTVDNTNSWNGKTVTIG